MEFITTQKGNRVLIYLGFEYLQFRVTNGIVSWRCRQSRSIKCKSMMKTQGEEIIQEPTNHCHDSCVQKIKANISKNKMKDAINAVGATPRNVMGDVMSEISNEVLAYLPKNSSLARSLRNHKKNDHEPNPTTIHFNIPDKYIDLILFDSGVDDPDRILMLGDRELLSELKKDTIYGDGTFDKVPNLYYQLYTWHAQVGNSYPPCVYVLLTKKTEGIYTKMFDIIKNLLPDLAPEKVLVDFEKACMNAAANAFPQAEIKGCYFHLCQSIVRKISNVGLKQEYQTSIDCKIMIKSLAALSFIPPHEVRDVFDQLADTFPDDDKYNDILTYFSSTYIQGPRGRRPQFPIDIWNHYEAALEKSPKTTNCCEGFHNALNSLFNCSHPCMWFLFEGLKKDLACHRLLLANVNAGRSEVKIRKYENLHTVIANHVRNYGEMDDKIRYLRRLANLQ